MPSAPPSAPVRVAIAATHPAVRRALESIVRLEREAELIAIVSDHRAAARCLMQHRPDVLVLALAGILRDGGAGIRSLAQLAPATALVVAATSSNDSYTSVVTAAGATALVPLDGAADHLGAVIRTAGR